MVHSRHRELWLFSSGATSEADLPYKAKECQTRGEGRPVYKETSPAFESQDLVDACN